MYKIFQTILINKQQLGLKIVNFFLKTCVDKNDYVTKNYLLKKLLFLNLNI